jgi:very-short-patch-repair endonuclease
MLDEVCRVQDGVVSRPQALAAGLTSEAIRQRLRSGRWQQLRRGVYATFSGEPGRPALLWAAVLRAGEHALLSHHTAAELVGLCEQPAVDIHVTIPSARRVTAVDGVLLHRSNRLERAAHPTRRPPQTRVEHTVLDLVETCATLDDAIGWLTRACGRRLTTADRLTAALAGCPRTHWRADLLAMLGEVDAGCHSPLEVRYLRAVERAHRLPPGDRQAARARPGGRYYDDVHYPSFGTIVELDGRLAHPVDAPFRDLRRDNATTAAGGVVLRYGWADVSRRPCAVAIQVDAVLRGRGWRGRIHPCRAPDCPVTSR